MSEGTDPAVEYSHGTSGAAVFRLHIWEPLKINFYIDVCRKRNESTRLFAYFVQLFACFAVKSFLTAKHAKDTQGTQKNFCIIRGSHMNIAVDIGNTNLKCVASFPDGQGEFRSWTIPPRGDNLDQFVFHFLLRWGAESGTGRLMPSVYSKPITWRIIQTGKLEWQRLKMEIRRIRPRDQFKLVTRQQIPLKLDVDSPDNVGIDRLLAAFAAVKKYDDSPMLVVDAGTAITVDVVCDRKFSGGAILPGLVALSRIYPQISEKLPLISIPEYPETIDRKPPMYPGRNTEDAIRSGLYWGSVGAIRQLYDIIISKTHKLRLVVTGGDAEHLLHGLVCMIPPKRIRHHDALAVEGITLLPCFGN